MTLQFPHGQPGDLLYTRSTGVVGAGIRFGQDVDLFGWWAADKALFRRMVLRDGPQEFGSPAWGNHIAVVGDGCLIEALARGVVRSPLSKYRLSEAVVLPLETVRPGVTVRERAAAVAYAEKQAELHDSYGWLGITSIALQLTTPARLDVEWDGAMICSALGARAWEHAGVILPTRAAGTTMPCQLRRMVGRL